MNKKLSTSTFIISQILILLVGLFLIGVLYFILNTPPVQKKEILRKPITSQPASLKLDLTEPDDDKLIFSSKIQIEGKTTPYSNVVISSNSEDQLVQSGASGSFSTRFSLQPGINEIEVVVFDSSGEQRSATWTIYYSKEKI